MSNPHGRDARPTREQLGGRLRALREAAGLSGYRIGQLKPEGWSQNKVWRVEAGRHVPKSDELRTLLNLYGADDAERALLLDWVDRLTPNTVKRGTLLRRYGTAGFQARIGRLEKEASVVRAFQPAMVLGMLQTEAYAREVFGPEDPEGVAERARRAQRLLRDGGRRWELVQPVGAYLWNLGGEQVMAEQMEAIIAASRLPHVDLRIVTPQQRVDFYATHGFHIYDDATVVVGVLTGTSISPDPDDVALYVEQFEQLWSAGVGGDAARQALSEVAEQYRALP